MIKKLLTKGKKIEQPKLRLWQTYLDDKYSFQLVLRKLIK